MAFAAAACRIDSPCGLSAAHPAGSSPLVANWQAHLYELLGPYLDAAHLLTSPAFDPDFPTSLGATLGATPANWTLFFRCVPSEPLCSL